VATKRLVSEVSVGLLSLAFFAPVGVPSAAAPPASIALSPTCGSVGENVQVTGSSWIAGTDITISFDGTPVATVKGTDIKAPGGTFTASMTIPSRALRGSPYTVSAGQTSNAVVVRSATAPFSIPCASLTLNPVCGSAGDQVAVHGAGFRSDITVSLTFTPPAGTGPIATSVPGADSTFDVVIKVPSDPPGQYVVAAVQLRTQAAARAIFTIPCVKAAIKLVPKVGPPGTVVTVTGTGFPIGSIVKLSWSQGIPIKIASITIGTSQGFQIRLLIFPHDELGKRRLNAGPDLSVPSAILFNIATADFVVVPGMSQPRDFSWRH
jgi:hypothetical protein